MTIHKAKGLEFPVVIYPFAETPLYPNNDETNWYETEGEDFNGFESLLISQKKGLLNLDDKSAALYNEKRQQQQLDNLNMLYVALTRSVEQLHVITRITQKTEPTSDPKSFADLFVNYLDDIKQFDVQKDHYAFGNPKKISQDRQENKNGIQLSLISSPKENHNLFIVTKAERLWDESRTESINEGNLLHDILAGIAYETDIPLALKNARASGVLEQNRWEYFNHQLEKLVSELKVEGFFNIKHTVYNERELIHNERILRPDRVEFDSKNQAYLLDYKTGAPHSSHVQQINDYADALTASGMTIGKKILVYVNEKQTIHPV